MQDVAHQNQDAAGPVYLTEPVAPACDFSIVTLVANQESYDRMVASFQAGGFTAPGTEFLALDNRTENRFDAFSALRAVLPRLRGKYIVLAHDDLELIDDGADTLKALLEDLERRDPNWIIAGNAGGYEQTFGIRRVRYLEDPHGQSRTVDGITKVASLDENFQVMPRARMVLPSIDLDGFHCSGADLCLRAGLAGGTCYIVPFYLRHHSGGTMDHRFYDAKAVVERKYAPLLRRRKLIAGASVLYLGLGGRVLSKYDDATIWLPWILRRARRGFHKVWRGVCKVTGIPYTPKFGPNTNR